jgi:hypothetical protein
MQPARLQERLESLYDLDCRHRVDDFLLTDRAAALALAGHGALNGGPEALLVHQNGEELGVSLYLDRDLLERLAGINPAAGLNPDEANDLLAVIEGVSHFLYLIWNAGHARPVTQLELELQAEVDKFVTWTLLLDGGAAPAAWDGVHDALFRRYRLREDLSDGEHARYRQASDLAERYCRSLLGHPSRRSGRPLVPELRRFYRMPQGRKIRHIRALAG